ncbi:MAG: TrkA family potassium uptake protein [Chloroflexi bacterium]|nr:TrkA family potassium uptake protein [Chloroflexota bacterium]
MYIVVIGGGRVGYYLSKALLDEGHEVLVIEKSGNIVETINEELGSIAVRGDGCEASTLDSVGTGRADMLVAVTGDDEDNLVACQVAKYKFKVPRTVSRVRNPEREQLFRKLGIDVTVSTTNIILEAIEKEVPTHPLTHLLTVNKGLEIVDVRISPGSVTAGKAIKDLSVPGDARLVLILHQDAQPRVPGPNTILEEGDEVIALTTPEQEGTLRAALRGA